MVAALFVETGGCYFGLPNVDPWDEQRDARLYAGPWPVVAHPPCSRWCHMAPVNQARYGQKVGDDGVCFAAALRIVRFFGGVLEHPADSYAWDWFFLQRPERGRWLRAHGGSFPSWRQGWADRAFVTEVSQVAYGHRARKRTWLYCVGREEPPPLDWSETAPTAWVSTDRPRAELAAMGIDQLSKKEAKRTPLPFRDLLLSIAASATPTDPPRDALGEKP